MELTLLLLEDIIWAALAAVGFGILFNVPVRTLAACALCGAVGHGLRTLIYIKFGVSMEASAFIGAATVGFLGEYLSHKVHAPAPVFTIAGVIPMVPGVFAYKAMMGMIKLTYADPNTSHILMSETLSFAIKTGLIVAGLAVGIAVPVLIFKRVRP